MLTKAEEITFDLGTSKRANNRVINDDDDEKEEEVGNEELRIGQITVRFTMKITRKKLVT